MAKDELSVLLIGAGQIARTTHIPALQRIEGVHIAGVCDVNENAAAALAADFDIPARGTDARKMLDELTPDAVMVCVPNRFHYPMVIEALKSGAHVFCEKPPAMDPVQASEMEKAAKEAGRILTYGFHFRHDGRTAMLKREVLAGRLGEIYHAEAVWTRRRGIPGWGCFTDRSMQGGGALIDLGAHVLDLAAYLMDYPEPVSAMAVSADRIGRQGGTGLMGAWDRERFTVEDGLFGTICFVGGLSLSVKTAFALHQKEANEREVRIYGARAGAALFAGERYTADDTGLLDGCFYTDPSSEPEADPHFACDRNFILAAMGKEEILVSARQGTYVQRLISLLYEAAGKEDHIAYAHVGRKTED